MVRKMKDKPIFIKKGEEKSVISRPGINFKIMIQSGKMEGIIAEIEPHTESKWYKHSGEEIHLVLEGKIEYIVGELSYKLREGDILWHKSSIKHKAKNIHGEKGKYITIGTPPTFIPTDV